MRDVHALCVENTQKMLHLVPTKLANVAHNVFGTPYASALNQSDGVIEICQNTAMHCKTRSLTVNLRTIALVCVVAEQVTCSEVKGNEQILKAFSDLAAAAFPNSSLVQGSDGALYGTTHYPLSGAVFKLNPDGTGFSILLSSDSTVRGPVGLVQGADGFLYLTCSGGGAHGAGAVFKLNPDGTGNTLLYSFGNSAKDGAIPEAPLVQGYGGGFYGTTFAGGNSNLGTIFRLNSDGTGYSLLHSFGSATNDALSPQTALVQGRDGGLYGTTRLGGTSNFGTVFRVNTNGSDYSVLHSFAGSPLDGTWPEVGLVAGDDGALYGATTYGGSSNAGTAFRLNTNGTAYRVLHNFDYSPASALFGGYLVQGPDGGLLRHHRELWDWVVGSCIPAEPWTGRTIASFTCSVGLLEMAVPQTHWC